MSDYKFKHECDAMPEGVEFFQLGFSESSQFYLKQYERGVVRNETVLYNFRFCPYCGEDMKKEGA